MKVNPTHKVAVALALSVCINTHARTYIVDRGETWESVAAKWRVYVEELRAKNKFLPSLYHGLEIDLPETASEQPYHDSGFLLNRQLNDDLAVIEAKLSTNAYDIDINLIQYIEDRFGHSISRLEYIKGLANANLTAYSSAYDYYKKAFEMSADSTLSGANVNQLPALMAEMKHQSEERDKRIAAYKAEEARKKEEAEKHATRTATSSYYTTSQTSTASTSSSSTYNSWGWNGWTTPNWSTWGWSNPFPTTPQIDWNSIPPTNYNFTIMPNWDQIPVGGYDTYPANDFGGSSFDNSAGNTSSGRDPIQYTDVTCGTCDGRGYIIKDGVTFGQTGTKYCAECGRHVDLAHTHHPCPACRGKKTERRRVR